MARTKIDVHARTLSMEFDDKVDRFNIFDALKHPSEGHSAFHLDLLHEFIDTHVSNFLHDFHAPSLTDSYTFHACTNSETCSFCIDEFFNIDVDSNCTSLYTCHACTDSEMCDSCIDEFLNIVIDSPAPDWTPSFDLQCDISLYALGTVLAAYEYDFLPP
ncbi:hypothetical protein Lal_00014123 [Lupinus albus]|nr:hypothetical protein Lal_00014123 [Lupinus albus]